MNTFILYRQRHYKSNDGHTTLSDGPLVLNTPTTSIIKLDLDTLVATAKTLDPAFDHNSDLLRSLDGPRRPPGDKDIINVPVDPEVLAEFILKYRHE